MIRPACLSFRRARGGLAIRRSDLDTRCVGKGKKATHGIIAPISCYAARAVRFLEIT